MENKIKPVLYVDVDNTTINSIKKIVDIWKRKHNGKSDYKPIHWTEINSFDFVELNISKEELLSYFNSEEFFTDLDFMDNAKLVLLFFLAKGYKVKFVSMGLNSNLELKKEWLFKDNLFEEAEFIGINLEEYKDKSHIDMSDGILIDDEIRYLNTSNAMEKICFGSIYDWNHDWSGTRCWNWFEVYKYITQKYGN